ncbi:MAG TPA: hypothetical protein PLG73_01030, partial [Candidatus Sumerlaeota bacterium]|nr:hypothetical protein [Candidatus Sumerlaeota bacterium]
WNMLASFQIESFPRIQQIFTELAAEPHTTNFVKGLLTTKDVAFYFLASFLFLFIASKTLDARRWRV